MLAVLQVSCENQSTTIHSTQFMVRTEEGSVLYLYTEFEADSSILLKNVTGPEILKNWVLGHAHLGAVLRSTRREGLASISVPNLKRIA